MRRDFLRYFCGLALIAAFVAVGVHAWLGEPQSHRVVGTSPAPPPGWTPIEWPFLNDAFGKGQSFACAREICGAPIRVTFRAKIGFCNCATGVSDDAELERIGDVGMIDVVNAPLGEGAPIAVGNMAGRARPYAAGRREAAQRLLSLAFNERCDVIVAIAQAPNVAPADIEAQTLRFLNSPYVLRWATITLGL